MQQEMKKDYYKISKVIKMLGSDANALSGKTLLCTGTGGFLGQWLLRTVKQLNETVLEKPCKLLAYDISLPSSEVYEEFRDCGVIFHAHDLTKKLPIVSEKIDFVVHMAGIASPTHYKRFPLETIDVTLEGVRGTLEIARIHNAKFLFTSSSEVYQTPKIVPTPETEIGEIYPNNERSCYDISKLMAENLVYVYGKNLSVEACSIRIFNSFGVGMAEADSRILPRIASAAKSGKKMQIYKRDQLPTRTYCPAANTIAGLFKALIKGKKTEVYNIGISTNEISVQELIHLVNENCNVKVEYDFVVPTSVYIHEPLRRCPDIAKASKELGYVPLVSLEDGLIDFFEWSNERYTGIDH